MPETDGGIISLFYFRVKNRAHDRADADACLPRDAPNAAGGALGDHHYKRLRQRFALRFPSRAGAPAARLLYMPVAFHHPLHAALISSGENGAMTKLSSLFRVRLAAERERPALGHFRILD